MGILIAIIAVLVLIWIFNALMFGFGALLGIGSLFTHPVDGRRRGRSARKQAEILEVQRQMEAGEIPYDEYRYNNGYERL